MSYPYNHTITNPGFETGDATGWSTISPATGTTPTVATTTGGNSPHTGTYASLMSLSGVSLGWYGQTVTLDSSLLTDIDAGLLQAAYSFYVIKDTAESASIDTNNMMIDFYDASSVWISNMYKIKTTPTSSWTKVTLNAPIPTGARYIRISVRGIRNSGTQLSVCTDDNTLVITYTTTQPIIANLYSQEQFAISGWTNVTSTVATISSGGDAYNFDTMSTWTSASIGECYRTITISDSGQQTNIDTGTAGVYLSARIATFSTTDKGQLYLEFYNGSSTIIGSRVLSDASPYTPDVAGESKTIINSIPTGTRSIRIGLKGTRVAGTSLDFYVNRIFLGLTYGSLPSFTLIRTTQNPLLVSANSSGSYSRITQSTLLVSADTLAKIRVTQQCLLVLAAGGHGVTFSSFREPTFHDWVESGDNVNYISYLTTWHTIPAKDTISWSMTPYSYFFLKNSAQNDNSLKVQYFWDWSRGIDV